MAPPKLAWAILALCTCAFAVDAISTYEARLNVAEEIPPDVTGTTGSGNATVFFSGDPGARTGMQYAIDVVEIPLLKAAHIHQGAKGTNGPVIVYLIGPIANPTPVSNGSLGQGFITMANLNNPNNERNLSSIAELEQIISRGDAYVNVHNMANPKGVIRGQLVPAPVNPGAFGAGVPQAFLAAQGQPAKAAAG